MNCNPRWTHGALALASITLAIVSIGCGGQERAQTSSGASVGRQAVAASASGPAASPFATDDAPAASGPEESTAIPQDIGVPPDVAASVVDTLVTPGTVIEVTAEGSPDVEEVVLSDGIGNPQRLAYDSASDLWRASYRVPLRFPGERLGLAVTAKNDLKRWRRVWVFLGARSEAPKDSVQVEEK